MLAMDVSAPTNSMRISSGIVMARSRNPQPRRPVLRAAPVIVCDAFDRPRPLAPRKPESIDHGPCGR